MYIPNMSMCTKPYGNEISKIKKETRKKMCFYKWFHILYRKTAWRAHSEGTRRVAGEKKKNRQAGQSLPWTLRDKGSEPMASI